MYKGLVLTAARRFKLYISLFPDQDPLHSLSDYFNYANICMTDNFLQLNKDKTEILISGAKTKRQPIADNIRSLLRETLERDSKTRNLGVIIYSGLHFKSPINHLIK